MRKKRAVAGQDWEFDGKTITVHIPMIWKRRGGRKVIIAPDGGDAWAPAKPRPDETLISALARAHWWKRMLEEGRYRSAAEIAEAESVTRSFVNRLLRLTLLAPDIQGAIIKRLGGAGFTDQVQHLRFSRKASAGVLKPRDFLGVELMAQVRSSMSRAV